MVYKERRDLIKAVTDWVEKEHKAGREVTDQEIADYFSISLREAKHIHNELKHGY